jgi:hypothetical protein
VRCAGRSGHVAEQPVPTWDRRETRQPRTGRARSAGRSVADREITSLSRERCSGLGARCGDRTRSGRYGLYGLGDADGEAKRFDLPTRLRSFAVAHVGEMGGRVRQQIPDDDQDGAGDGAYVFTAAKHNPARPGRQAGNAALVQARAHAACDRTYGKEKVYGSIP